MEMHIQRKREGGERKIDRETDRQRKTKSKAETQRKRGREQELGLWVLPLIL